MTVGGDASDLSVRLPEWTPRRVVAAGGAGFIGSHLCERLLDEGVDVVAIDNMITGSEANVAHLEGHPRFTLLRHDVTWFVDVRGPVDAVLHLASPASPADYLRHPLETLSAGSLGTSRLLELAERKRARFLLASTSEVYGDPLVHPQTESYWGNVNPTGPRAVYDEAKRFAEALTTAYHRARGLDVRIARIFNTMGPRMRPGDGRMIPAFISQSLRGVPLTIQGDGSQTRSVCFVSDLVEGVWRLLRSDVQGPVNLGNPDERSVLEIARTVAGVVGVEPRFEFLDAPADDPRRRRPDISRARRELGWEPRVDLEEGLDRAVAWFRTHLSVEAPV